MAILFDMDGVLIDSNQAHLDSWRKTAREEGFEFSDEIFWQTFGMTSESIVEKYWKNCESLTPDQVADVVRRKEDAFRYSIVDYVKPIDGALDFLAFLEEHGVKVAVGSSAPRVNVEYVLDWLKIGSYFHDAVVAGDQVRRGKPNPDIFLEAAKILGVAPETCIVIDDSRSGVNAGKNANMTTVGFFSKGHRAEEYQNADLVVSNYDELRAVLEIDSNGNVALKPHA